MALSKLVFGILQITVNSKHAVAAGGAMVGGRLLNCNGMDYMEKIPGFIKKY